MTNNENLSALVDGETNDLERARMLSAMRSDPALAATWERYHLIGMAVRQELAATGTANVADRVASALAGEPVPARVWGRAAKIASGMAIAASVAGLALFNLGQFTSPTPTLTAQAGKPAATLGTDRSATTPPALGALLVHHQQVAPANGVQGMIPYARLVGQEGARE
jgi:sigma-E factor negative regulatory protein RseA